MQRSALWLVAIAVIWSGVTSQLLGQDKSEIAPPENIPLETKDGVLLQATWFPGNKGKESVPVILLHDWKGSRGQYSEFGLHLQKLGYSVIIPDLRGHGDSVRVKGRDALIDVEKMTKLEVAAMLEDIETCKRFLMQKNNDGKLNIDLLTVVAAGGMSVHALEWSMRDWSYIPLNGKKQGQDVKAIVLLTPEKTLKGLSMNQLLKNPLIAGKGPIRPLSMYIAIGGKGQEKFTKDAKSIHSTIEKSRPKLTFTGSAAEQEAQRLEKQDLYYEELPVEFQGADLVNPQTNTNFHERVAAFIYYRVELKKDDFPWTDRKKN